MGGILGLDGPRSFWLPGPGLCRSYKLLVGEAWSLDSWLQSPSRSHV